MMFSSPKTPQAQQPPVISSLRVQQSSAGNVVAAVLGSTRLPGNLTWYGDFAAIAHHTDTGGGGGKGGGGGGGGGSTTYTYQTSVTIGLCGNQIQGIGKVWREKSSGGLDVLGGSSTVFTGAPGQSAWGYLTSLHPDQALAYAGLAYVAVASLDLADNANLPNLSFEVMGGGTPVAWWSGSGPFDATPESCVAAALTDPSWGAALPSALLDDLSGYGLWCRAQGFGLAAALTESRAARDILKDWLTATLADAVWSSGKLKIISYADQPVSGNGVTYSPNLTPVLVVDDGMMVPDPGQPPLKTTRKDPMDLYNQVTVEYWDRANDYNTATAVSEDAAHVDSYGPRPAPSVTAHFIASAAMAQHVADLARDRGLGVLASYEWKMGSPAALLEPMDIVALTDPAQGLLAYPVRITEIDEQDDTLFTVKAEDIPGCLGGMAARPLAVGQGYAANLNVDPGNVNPPLLFEPPLGLTVTGLELWAAVSGGPLWGGCTVWASLDGSSYVRIGTISSPARQGALTAGMTTGAALDSVNTLAVDLSQCRGQLLSGSLLDVLALNTLCWVADDSGGGELLAYQTATLNGPYRYALTTLVRGAYGTPITSHAAAAAFARLDGAIFKYPFQAEQIGRTLSLKFTSFNLWAAAEQDISTVPAYSWRVTGSALAVRLPDVTGLATAYVGGITQLTWTAVVDDRDLDYEIRQGTAWSTARVLGRTPLTQAPAQGDGSYWLAAHYRLPDGTDLYSPNPLMIMVAGAQLVRNVVANVSEAATGWGGALVNAAVVGDVVEVEGSGDMLALANIFAVIDVIEYGGVSPSASYTIPLAHRVSVGRVAPCNVVCSLALHGQSVVDNVLVQADMLGVTDVTGWALGANVEAVPQLRLSQDGVTWGAWQTWSPGAYAAMSFDFRVLLSSFDPQVIPVLADFSFLVDVPDRLDKFTGLSIPAGGLSLSYVAGLQGNPAAAFNGGTAGQGTPPNVQVTIVGGSPGDDAILTGQSVSGFTLQVINGGVGVARTVNIIVQGY